MTLRNHIAWYAKQLLPLSYIGGGLRWRMWMGRCFDVRKAG
jgi:hypothetical protein